MLLIERDDYRVGFNRKANGRVDPRNFTATISKINAFGEVRISFNSSLSIEPDLQPASKTSGKRQLLRMEQIT